jgi:hypothetical protein
MNKFGLVLNDWERNVVQVALTHLKEMHEDISYNIHLKEQIVNETPELSYNVINTCKELLISLK